MQTLLLHFQVEGKLKKEQYTHQDVAGVPRAWIERTTKLSKVWNSTQTLFLAPALSMRLRDCIPGCGQE